MAIPSPCPGRGALRPVGKSRYGLEYGNPAGIGKQPRPVKYTDPAPASPANSSIIDSTAKVLIDIPTERQNPTGIAEGCVMHWVRKAA